jgi:hypothetical protein
VCPHLETLGRHAKKTYYESYVSTLFLCRVIQLNTLEDRNVTDKSHWDGALRFLEGALQEKIATNEANLREQVRSLTNCVFSNYYF